MSQYLIFQHFIICPYILRLILLSKQHSFKTLKTPIYFAPSSDHALLMFYSCFTHALLLIKLKWFIIEISLCVKANVICRVGRDTGIYIVFK